MLIAGSGRTVDWSASASFARCSASQVSTSLPLLPSCSNAVRFFPFNVAQLGLDFLLDEEGDVVLWPDPLFIHRNAHCLI